MPGAKAHLPVSGNNSLRISRSLSLPPSFASSRYGRWEGSRGGSGRSCSGERLPSSSSARSHRPRSRRDKHRRDGLFVRHVCRGGGALPERVPRLALIPVLPARPSPGQLLALVIFGFGVLSALLMNDTLAIIGTPLVLGLAAQSRLPKKLLLFALAFAITTGSVASPIGNPQNLLVAVNSGMTAPFVTFASWLLLPTIASLAAAWLVLRLYYRREFSPSAPAVCEPSPAAVPDPVLTRIVKCSLAILIGLALANIAASLVTGAIVIPLPLIGLAAALPIIIFSGERVAVLKAIDWCTLVFFAAMFVLMAAVWQTGFFQSLAGVAGVTSVPAILGTSVVISQFISNVPFVALFQPLILQAGGRTAQLMALAAGSTIAGNLTILGAASNVIIIQQAEARGRR